MNWTHINDQRPEPNEQVLIYVPVNAYFWARYNDDTKQWHYYSGGHVNINIANAPLWFRPTPPDDELNVDGNFIDVINAAVKK